MGAGYSSISLKTPVAVLEKMMNPNR